MTGWLRSLFIIMMFIEGCRGFFNGTWFEAQKNCQNQGGKLPINPSESTDGFYQWTAYHKRLSSWIKILGCYDENISYEMKRNVSSLGECQELCTSKNISTFGIQMTTCICVDHPSDTIPLPPENCSYNCTQKTKMNMFLFNTCGGPSAFNMYKSDTPFENGIVTSEQNSTCVGIQCGGDSKYLYVDNCKLLDHKDCQGNGNRSSESSLRQGMKNCKISRSLSYLLGNFHMEKITQGCHLFTKTMAEQTRLGIANQIYDSSSYKELHTKYQEVVECQECSNSSCRFVNCSTTGKYLCKGGASSSPTSRGAFVKTNIQPTVYFGINLTTLYTHVSTITATWEIPESEDDSPTIATLFPVIAVVVVVVMIALLLLVVLFRRKTRQIQNRSHPQRSMPNAHNNTEMTATSTIYNVVRSRKESSKLESERDIEKESPYSKGEDGVYDHPRNNQARRKQTEDIYHHASIVTSNYAEMNEVQTSRIDNIYDRSGSCTKTSDDNAYDQADIRAPPMGASVSSQ
ncbi:uncharacterized protein LOC125655769 isoform X2 [Ostrea edulis]|uniref:uncharacterized protein LOC125655769 isoform X2 n=1 Tax=Ostrea edulis TaxID=37623 RepID=UPI0024AF77FC|nr:uncharacterized protein LOC125655769 isoform X2 [Ostrea edulis]